MPFSEKKTREKERDRLSSMVSRACAEGEVSGFYEGDECAGHSLSRCSCIRFHVAKHAPHAVRPIRAPIKRKIFMLKNIYAILIERGAYLLVYSPA